MHGIQNFPVSCRMPVYDVLSHRSQCCARGRAVSSSHRPVRRPVPKTYVVSTIPAVSTIVPLHLVCNAHPLETAIPPLFWGPRVRPRMRTCQANIAVLVVLAGSTRVLPLHPFWTRGSVGTRIHALLDFTQASFSLVSSMPILRLEDPTTQT